MSSQKEQMIQRIQSIYLFVVFLLLGVIPNFVDLWVINEGAAKSINDLFDEELFLLKLIPVLFYIGALISVISLGMFKNRQLQFVLGRLNILINLFLLGELIYLSLTLSGEAMVSEKGIGMFLPVLAILLLVLANRAIKRDEDLVKSVDRLR